MANNQVEVYSYKMIVQVPEAMKSLLTLDDTLGVVSNNHLYASEQLAMTAANARHGQLTVAIEIVKQLATLSDEQIRDLNSNHSGSILVDPTTIHLQLLSTQTHEFRDYRNN